MAIKGTKEDLLRQAGWQLKDTAKMQFAILMPGHPKFMWADPVGNLYDDVDEAWDEFSREKPPESLRGKPQQIVVGDRGTGYRFAFSLSDARYFGFIDKFACHEIWALRFRDGTLALADRDVHNEDPFYHVYSEPVE